MIKTCRVCGVDKDVNDFYTFKDTRNKNGKGIYLKHLCKVCDKKNGIKQKEKSRKRKRKFVWNFKKNNPCVDCGQKNPVVLQFDHVDEKKEKNISLLSQGGHSMKALKEEIEKCEIRCANCHFIKTTKEQNWYKFEIEEDGCHTLLEWMEKNL